MVATSGTSLTEMLTLYGAQIATGQLSIDHKNLAPTQWVSIARFILDQLPSYTRGFKPLKEIVQRQDNETELRMTHALPQLWRASIKRSDVFLYCGTARGWFPYGRTIYERFGMAPKLDGKKPMPIRREDLVLSRDKKLHLVSMTWLPKTEWENPSSTFPTLKAFWYEADLESFTIQEVSNLRFAELIETHQEEAEDYLVPYMVNAIMKAVAETIKDTRNEYERILGVKQTITSSCTNIGVTLIEH